MEDDSEGPWGRRRCAVEGAQGDGGVEVRRNEERSRIPRLKTPLCGSASGDPVVGVSYVLIEGLLGERSCCCSV